MKSSGAQQISQQPDKKSAKPQNLTNTQVESGLEAVPLSAAGELGDIVAQSPSKLSHNQWLRLQRSIGNRSVEKIIQRSTSGDHQETVRTVSQIPVGTSFIQRSALSDELEQIWITGDKEQFFSRLCNLGASDQDVVDFVEQTLTGADLQRARRILGTEQPLSDAQRNALLTRLVSRMGSAEVAYASACQQVHERIQAEQQARAELISAIVGIGITFVVPGLSGAISRLVNEIPASASVGIHTIALGILDRADTIASAIGDAGKSAASSTIRSVISSSPRELLNAMQQGFAVAKDAIVGHVSNNITNRSALPDEELWLYVSNWDPAERNISRYLTEINAFYQRYQNQVAPIGQPGMELEPGIGSVQMTTVVWARHSGGDVLVQVDLRMGSLYYAGFIDADLQEMAISRVRSSRGVETYNWEDIRMIPASIPATAARRRGQGR